MSGSGTIAVVDSGVANLASVMAVLHRLNADAEITSDAGKIREAERVILPGVGSAAAAMAQLKAKKLVDVLRGLTQPVLGICLGMQLLFERSDEGGGVDGIGIIPGTVKLLSSAPDRPVPHMGWNRIAWRNGGHQFARGVENGSFAYFVHSYAVPVSDVAVATTEYGENFTAIAAHKNFFGCQFHPERSSVAGAKILKNFLEM